MRTMFDVDWPEAKNVGLFLVGFLIGFFAPSLLTQLKSIVMTKGQEYIAQRGDSMISIGKENIAGSVIFLLGGLLAVMALFVLSFFFIGVIVGLSARYILWYHLGLIAEPDVVTYFNNIKAWIGF